LSSSIFPLRKDPINPIKPTDPTDTADTDVVNPPSEETINIINNMIERQQFEQTNYVPLPTPFFSGAGTIKISNIIHEGTDYKRETHSKPLPTKKSSQNSSQNFEEDPDDDSDDPDDPSETTTIEKLQKIHKRYFIRFLPWELFLALFLTIGWFALMSFLTNMFGLPDFFGSFPYIHEDSDEDSDSDSD
jgi:hypothetical protein